MDEQNQTRSAVPTISGLILALAALVGLKSHQSPFATDVRGGFAPNQPTCQKIWARAFLTHQL